MEELEAIKKEFNDRIDKLIREKETTKFEHGKWYGGTVGKIDYKILFDSITNGTVKTMCSIDSYTGWGDANEYWSNEHDIKRFKPLTKEEVETALIKEAEKRYKVGCNVGGMIIDNKLHVVPKSERFFYDSGHDELWAYANPTNICVYKKGQWATIVKDEPVTICGYEVEYKNNRCWINVPGEKISYGKDELELFIHALAKPKIKSLNVGCNSQYKVTSEDIQKIIKNWKS